MLSVLSSSLWIGSEIATFSMQREFRGPSSSLGSQYLNQMTKITKNFSDPYDEKGNCFLFGLYIDSALASSIRVHVASKEHPDFPSLEVFSDYLQPELDAGKVIVDTHPLRHGRDLFPALSSLPYVTMRVAGMALRVLLRRPTSCSRQDGAPGILSASIPSSHGLRSATFPRTDKAAQSDDGALSDLCEPGTSAFSIFSFNSGRTADVFPASSTAGFSTSSRQRCAYSQLIGLIGPIKERSLLPRPYIDPLQNYLCRAAN